jgi:hypothetical protein
MKNLVLSRDQIAYFRTTFADWYSKYLHVRELKRRKIVFVRPISNVFLVCEFILTLAGIPKRMLRWEEN